MRITTSTYHGTAPKRTKASPAVMELAGRLGVEPYVVKRLARHLGVSLYWLDVTSRPDVVSGHPATWDGCIACGVHPTTGEPLRGEVPS